MSPRLFLHALFGSGVFITSCWLDFRTVTQKNVKPCILVTMAGYEFRISLKKLKGNVHTYAVLTVKLQSCDITFDFNDIHSLTAWCYIEICKNILFAQTLSVCYLPWVSTALEPRVESSSPHSEDSTVVKNNTLYLHSLS